MTNEKKQYLQIDKSILVIDFFVWFCCFHWRGCFYLFKWLAGWYLKWTECCSHVPFISIHPLKGLFSHTSVNTVIPHIGRHSCTRPTAMNWNVQVEQKFEGQACGPAHQPWAPPGTLWPEPTPPSCAVTRCAAGLCWMNGHSHISLRSIHWSNCVCKYRTGSWKSRGR